MKYLLTILFLWGVAYGQSTVYLRADTVKVMKQGGNANFQVLNATKDSTNGVLINVGSGITAFKRIRAINDSQFTVGGDTITIAGAAGGGSSDPTAIIKNANYGGYSLLNFHNSVDSVIAKQLIAGTNITFDSTANTITINGGAGTTYSAGYGIGISGSTISTDTFTIQSRLRGLKLVDSTLSLLLANNGLTKTGYTVKLGGAIAAATSIIPSGFALDVTTDNVATTQTNFTGLNIVNNTVATVGAQQYSPALRFRSSGWKTTATAAAQSIDIREWTQPIQGTTAPTAFHNWDMSINGGTYWNILRIYSAGGIQVTAHGGGNGGVSFTSATPTANTILTGTQLIMQTSGTTASNAFYFNANSGYSHTSGNVYLMNAIAGINGFNPTSGTGTFTHTYVNPIINQTGGASGISYGLNIDPTLTAAADWRAISVSAGRSFLKAVIVGDATALSNANYTVGNNDYFIELPDLSSEAANRNIVMNAASAGRMLTVFNLNSDATWKWSFSGATVEDATGSAITTLTDQKTYTLTYHSSKWRVTSVY